MEEMELRTLILERVAALEPIGRRALAARLHLAEREVRAAAEALKRAGCLTQSASGMELTPQGQSLVEGGADGQQRAADIIGHRIVALADAGRRAGLRRPRRRGHRFRGDGRGGARGGAADPLPFAGRACDGGDGRTNRRQNGGGDHGRRARWRSRLFRHRAAWAAASARRRTRWPSALRRSWAATIVFCTCRTGLSEAAADELARLPQVREPLELVRHADVLLYGIGRAMDLAQRRGLSRAEQETLRAEGAVAEALGFYLNAEGHVVGGGSSLAFKPEDIGRKNRAAAVAAGRAKAEAILAVCAHHPHKLLVVDEGAALRMLELLRREE